MMYWSPDSGWAYLLMGVSMVLFWGLVIGAIVLVVRAVGRENTRAPLPGQDPQQILAQRYARGEIDDAEYRQRLSVLRGTPGAAR